MKKSIFLLLLAVGVVAGGAAFYTKYVGGPPTSSYRTANVKRGDLMITISATGTLEPEEVVDVGSQVIGPILNLGMDPRSDTDPAFKDKRIDYGSPVDEGTVLAQVDPAVYTANRDQAQAALERAKADLGQLVAKRNQAEAEWNRAQRLRNMSIGSKGNLSPTGDTLNLSMPIKAISDSDYDLARANFEVAKANVSVGESTILQTQSALQLSETNLGYTTIKSPVKGTIVDRRVNVGQTVVSSLSATSLFLIAKDLRQIQVWSSVNEADIGRLKLGMPVNYTVDAFPNDVFHGTIAQIRLNATMTQNVVTYTVVIATDNSDMKLLPYLTADVKFEVDNRKDVLLVPNIALRWQPKAEQISPDAREAAESPSPRRSGKEGKSEAENNTASTGDVAKAETTGEQAAGMAPDGKAEGDKAAKTSGTKTGEPGAPAAGGKTDGKASSGRTHKKSGKEHTERGTLWVKDGDYVRPFAVRVGPTDSTLTEVSGGELADGMEIVVGENRDRGSADAPTNPFAPTFSRGPKGGGGGGQGKGPGGGKGQ